MVVAVPSSAGNRFRQRKISTKQTLQIFKQSQLSDIDNEDLQQRDIQEIETGVEKNEEEEVHLQKILKKTGITNTSETYIPTPDASKKWAEADKYYVGEFVSPESYIKSSCQVEDYAGCSYNMDEDDEEFLKNLNKGSDTKKNKPLTEDEFEILMEAFEKVITEKQPFLITDPQQILPLEEVKLALINEPSSSTEDIHKVLSEELGVHPFVTLLDAKMPTNSRALSELVKLYGEQVYEHYREKKIARLGKSITPTLKFTGEEDVDAYICFRQRQFRQQRKTRRADTQSSEKLIKLYQELKYTKDLTFLVAQREIKRLESIQTDQEIFELRCKVKSLKRELGITDSDEDLVAHKKKKVIPPPEPKVEEIKKDKRVLSKINNNVAPDSRTKSGEDLTGSDSPQQFQAYVKLPPSKIPDMELETVQYLLKNKDVSMQKFVEEKLKKRKQIDVGFTNLTDDPNNPYFEIGIQDRKILDSTHIPYSSIASSLFDVQSFGYIPNIDKFSQTGSSSRDNEAVVFNPNSKHITKKFVPEKYSPFTSETVKTSDPIMTLRKRVGRLGQVYIDRKNMINYTADDDEEEAADVEEDVEMKDAKERLEDRWKFDSDVSAYSFGSDLFSDDPSKLNSISNETQVIRFGSMLLSKAYEILKESIMQQRHHLYLQQMQRLQAQQKHQKQQQAQAQAQVQGQIQAQGIQQGQRANGTSSPGPSNQQSQSQKYQQGSRSTPVNTHPQVEQLRSAHQTPTPNVMNKVHAPIKTEH